AIQGGGGLFSQGAAPQPRGGDTETHPQPPFEALSDAAVSGKAARALVPIENSLHGSIHGNYDRLRTLDLHIVGETQLRIHQCLIARPKATLSSIRRVASHPVALAQCRRVFAGRPQLPQVAAYDPPRAVP